MSDNDDINAGKLEKPDFARTESESMLLGGEVLRLFLGRRKLEAEAEENTPPICLPPSIFISLSLSHSAAFSRFSSNFRAISACFCLSKPFLPSFSHRLLSATRFRTMFRVNQNSPFVSPFLPFVPVPPFAFTR